MNQLVENNNVDKTEEYLSQISTSNLYCQPVVNTNNSIVDALLIQKYALAKKQDIDIQLLFNDLSNFSMKDTDIVVMLANLLDNAIEAAQKCAAEKSIRVKLFIEENQLVVSVHNTTTLADCSTGFSLKSTKQNAKLHGYGFKNVKEVLEKYQGQYLFECENGWFKFVALIPN